MKCGEHHPPAPSSKEEGELTAKAPSSLREGVGGGGPTREVMLGRAAGMRRNLPEPERRLWMELRSSRFYGFKFRRQAVVGNRIVDFFRPPKGLVIEIDGVTHDPEIDEGRDRNMVKATGYRILRFTNDEVMRNLEGVLMMIKMALDAQPDRWPGRDGHHPPAPSFKEEGESYAKPQEGPSFKEEGESYAKPKEAPSSEEEGG